MSLEEDEYTSVAWNTGATDVLQTEERSDDETGSNTQPQFGPSLTAGSESTAFSVTPYSLHDESVAVSTSSEHIPKAQASPRNASNVNTTTYSMSITVTDPNRELEGTKEMFVSYLVTTKTTLETFAEPTANVRRRFQDFVWLHNSLVRDFPACVVPPLPEKHRLEYITGDRFSTEFLEKRRMSLQHFLKRLARHPTLQRSEYFRIFLESREWNAESMYRRQKANEGMLENLGDALMNAFSKIRKPDPRFTEIKETVDKLEENLQTIERLYQKITKRQMDLENDYAEFGNALAGLGGLETGITDSLDKFSDVISNFAQALKHMTEREEYEYLSQIRDYLSYCHCVKNVLKLRDQKQLDFEELSDLLQTAITEQDNLRTTGKASSGFSQFLRDKVDNIKGVDQEQARRERLSRLKDKIGELEKEVENSNDESDAFSNEVVKEFNIFEDIKAVELKEYMLAYTSSHVEYYKQSVELWESVIPLLKNIEVEI